MNTKTLSIVGLVLSFVFPVAGIIVSAICLKKYKTESSSDGKDLAMTGLIIGILMTMSLIFSSIIIIYTMNTVANEFMS